MQQAITISAKGRLASPAVNCSEACAAPVAVTHNSIGADISIGTATGLGTVTITNMGYDR